VGFTKPKAKALKHSSSGIRTGDGIREIPLSGHGVCEPKTRRRADRFEFSIGERSRRRAQNGGIPVVEDEDFYIYQIEPIQR
jgi:hypothetical protein